MYVKYHKDLSVCNLVIREVSKNRCLRDYLTKAYENKDPDICEEVNDPDIVNDCFLKYAIIYGEKDIY